MPKGKKAKSTGKKPISFNVELSIRRPLHEVFAAVLYPAPFFIQEASGPLAEGRTVTWRFAEMPKGFSVQVQDVLPDKRIQFDWPRGEGSAVNRVQFTFTPYDDRVTTVYISESGWPATNAGREASYRNCMGWMHMACSLKAYLEYGVNLRQGSFVHMKF